VTATLVREPRRGLGHAPRGGLGLARLGVLGATLILVLAVAAPGAGLLAPAPARAASTDLTLVTDATYTVVPASRRIAVSVAITARNHTVETKTHKFYFDHAFLAVQPGSTGFKVTGAKGANVRVSKTTKDARLLRLDFPRLYSGKSTAFRLSFVLPGTGKGANPQVRVGSGLVTMPVWAFASNGAPGSSVSVRFPAGWDVAVESGSFAHRSKGSDGGTVLASGPLSAPLTFFAFVSAQHPAVYRDKQMQVAVGGDTARLTLRGWADDARWTSHMGALLARALPVLGTEIGIPWPHRDPLVVQEAVSRESGAYAGLFDPAANRIEVAYWASDAVALHEAAHGWFNGNLVADRWAAEGFASWYAQRAATALKIKARPPELTDALKLAAFPLETWAPSGSATAQETFGYAASYALADAIAQRVGPDALAGTWASAAARVGAYQPPASARAAGAQPSPELVDGAPGWRGLLDLLQDQTGEDLSDVFATWVATPDDADQLRTRTAARASYERTLALAGDWALPRGVRDAMRAWQFDTAEALMADARTVVAQRNALESLAARDGMTLPGDLRQTFEAGGFVETSARAEAERQAIAAVETAGATRSSDNDLISRIGSLGAHPEQDLRDAQRLLAAGDLDGTHAAAARAQQAWTGAWEEGRRRALFGVAVVATILVLGGLIIGSVRRGRRRRRGMMAHHDLRADVR
jgi:hypothetical protein